MRDLLDCNLAVLLWTNYFVISLCIADIRSLRDCSIGHGVGLDLEGYADDRTGSGGRAPPAPSDRRGRGTRLLMAYLAFGIAATHDYLDWSRVRAGRRT